LGCTRVAERRRERSRGEQVRDATSVRFEVPRQGARHGSLAVVLQAPRGVPKNVANETSTEVRPLLDQGSQCGSAGERLFVESPRGVDGPSLGGLDRANPVELLSRTVGSSATLTARQAGLTE
jgi:hypothetical protein